MELGLEAGLYASASMSLSAAWELPGSWPATTNLGEAGSWLKAAVLVHAGFIQNKLPYWAR